MHVITGTNVYRYQWCIMATPIFSTWFCPIQSIHDDVIQWKHFPRYWPFVRGIHRSPVNSSHKGQWRRALMFCLIFTWINGWVNNREAGDLRRHQAHYDIIVMQDIFAHVVWYALASHAWHTKIKCTSLSISRIRKEWHLNNLDLSGISSLFMEPENMTRRVLVTYICVNELLYYWFR